MLKIAIIGSRGIPAKYGGFETFVEEISKRLVDRGFDIYVSCEGGSYPKISLYNGVKLFYFPVRPFYRLIYETIYDIYSLVKSSFTCDYIYMLGYGAGFFFFIPRIFGKKLFVNVDGIEWKRDKYSKFEKRILYYSEKFAVFFSNVIIADSTEIAKYIEYSYTKTTKYIAYGVDVTALENWDSSKFSLVNADSSFLKIEKDLYFLVVARLEPENNIYPIINGFLASSTNKKLVVIGNFMSTGYKEKISHLINKYNASDKIIFTGGIYQKNLLNMLRQNCFAYIHGHSAGGTNPSLLEAMAMYNIVIGHDNQFNREVGADTILYFKDSQDLAFTIECLEHNYESYIKLKEVAQKRVIKNYSWEDIATKYATMFRTISESDTHG